MNRRRRLGILYFLTVILLAAAMPLAAPALSEAQPASSAELTRVVGRVEVLRKGQAQWVPGVIGARLVEGDDIRAFSGATAELTLPDTSTLMLAENSRLLISRLELDQKNQSRTVLVHLAVGKVRAIIAQAAIALVRARQSNFAITTPTAVAAARGTIVWVFTDGSGTVVAVEPQAGIPSRVDCLPLRGVRARQGAKPQTIFAGRMATDCGTPVAIQQQFLTFTNKATENSPFLSGPIIAPSPDFVLQLLTFGLAATDGTFPTSFFVTGDVSSFLGGGPPSFGQDIINAQGPPLQPPGPPPTIPPISPQ